MEIRIDKEIKKVLPPMAYSEFLGLEESIKKEGNRDEISIWKGENILLDGHNRYKICKAHDIPLKKPFKEIELESRDQAILWIIKNQAKTRRNLNKSQKAILGVKYKQIYAKEAEKRMKAGKPSEAVHKGRASNQAGEYFGVSGRYIDDAEKLEQKNPLVIKEVFEGKITLSEAIKKEKNKEKEKKRKQEREKKLSRSKIKPKLEIIEGDFFKEIKQVKRQYNLIYVDPPYNILKEDWDKFNEQEFKEFTEKWLESILPKLSEDGRIYINFSQEFMFKFHEWMQPFLKKYNLILGNVIIWNYKNNMKPHDKKQYKYSYEPIFYYRKTNAGDLTDLEDYGEERQDVWTIATPQSNYNIDKKQHPAQKPQELMRRIILTGSKPGDWVLDGFAGAGTTGLVAMENERNVTLIEKDKEYIKIIKEKLK
ncbi:MAG: DNA modification methylase [Candidatus Odinarchaeia archaeon]